MRPRLPVARALGGAGAAFTLSVLAIAAPAAALTRGGGDPRTDCLAEFGGTPGATAPASHPRVVRCTDGDPTCDLDPTPGVCGVRVSVCLNVTDPELPLCAPADLEEYAVENEQPDTNPLHDFDFQALEDELTFLTLPVEATQQNVCTAEVGMSVYLPVRLRRGAATWRRGKKQLRTTVRGGAPGAPSDEDRLKLVCQPADGATACDGVTSTFDQIQKHVFTPTSCARSTCHNVQQAPHEMSLSPGEAYANLVGVAANNPVAAGAGKLRVAPGDPTGSFLVQKLRGLLAPGEGARMPFGLKPLPEAAVVLIEEWIAAGAPATGFAAPSGCPGP